MEEMSGPVLERVPDQAPDPLVERRDAVRALVPEAFVEGVLDQERLNNALGLASASGVERYGLSWKGKADSIQVLQEPACGTLAPLLDESIGFDGARHVFVEGENLAVLRLLYSAYFEQVDLIYIDPPYNTGKDRVYRDSYASRRDEYVAETGQADEEGNQLVANPETSGRFHSLWLSMMYPRLFMASRLLRPDGVLLVSIDDHEVHNLRLMLDEIFGPENFIAQLVWDKTRKNDAKFWSVGHEYILVYAKSQAYLRENGLVWREPKPGAAEIWVEYERLREEHGDDDAAVQAALRQWYAELPQDHPSKKLSRYKWVDADGPWRDRDISWPGGDGPRYDVIHPETGQPCAVPEAGWRFAQPETMQRQIDLGLVVFREDHTDPPFRKAHLRPVAAEIVEEDEAADDAEEDAEVPANGIGMQVMGSVLYAQAQVAVKHLRALMDDKKVFDNPKDHSVLGRVFDYIVGSRRSPLIVDFFGGSASSAEAVLRSNAQDGGDRRFLLVQMAEETGERSGARRAGYETVSQVGLERIRRVIAAIDPPDNAGVRVFRLEESRLRPWSTPTDADGPGLEDALELAADRVLPGATDADLLWEIAVREGLSLDSQLANVQHETATRLWKFVDEARDQTIHVCLDDAVPERLAVDLGLGELDVLVVRDAALTDASAANLNFHCRLKVL